MTANEEPTLADISRHRSKGWLTGPFEFPAGVFAGGHSRTAWDTAPPIVRMIALSLDRPREGRPIPPPQPLACSFGDPAMAAFSQVVTDAYTRVYEVLDRLWRARETVKDRWIARLYGPPLPVKPYSQTVFLAAALAGQASPKPSVPTYDGRDARAELAAVSAARVEASRIATNFATDVIDAVNAADAAATRGDPRAVTVAEAAIRRAADTALTALRQDGG